MLLKASPAEGAFTASSYDPLSVLAESGLLGHNFDYVEFPRLRGDLDNNRVAELMQHLAHIDLKGMLHERIPEQPQEGLTQKKPSEEGNLENKTD